MERSRIGLGKGMQEMSLSLLASFLPSFLHLLPLLPFRVSHERRCGKFWWGRERRGALFRDTCCSSLIENFYKARKNGTAMSHSRWQMAKRRKHPSCFMVSGGQSSVPPEGRGSRNGSESFSSNLLPAFSAYSV